MANPALIDKSKVVAYLLQHGLVVEGDEDTAELLTAMQYLRVHEEKIRFAL